MDRQQDSTVSTPIMLFDLRLANAIYLVPIALMFGTLYVLGNEIAASSISLIGYLISGVGMLVLAVGSTLEALFEEGTLATRGVAQGQVFYLGLFGILLGSVFLGVGLWRDDELSVGLSFLVVLPLTLVGFWVFNFAGLVSFNWIPIMVPYGLAWIVLGDSLRRRHRTIDSGDETSA